MTLAPEAALPVIDALLAHAFRRVAKVETAPSRSDRLDLQREQVPKVTRALRRYFRGMLRRGGVTKVETPWPIMQQKVYWENEAGVLYQALSPMMEAALNSGQFEAQSRIDALFAAFGADSSVPGGFNSKPEFALSLQLGDYDLSIQDELGQRVKGITDTTRTALQAQIAEGVDRGLSQKQIVNGVEGDMVNAPFKGLANTVEEWGSPRGRAKAIALTETANAYNLGQLVGYRNSGVVDEVIIFDGADCGWTAHDDPDLASGSTRTLEEAQAYPTAHPNCQRSWAPAPLKPADMQDRLTDIGAFDEQSPYFTPQTDEALDWAQEWQGDITRLPRHQKQAVKSYTSDGFESINGVLRGAREWQGAYDLDDPLWNSIDDLSDTMRPLPAKTKAYRSTDIRGFGLRGNESTDTVLDALKVGNEFNEPGFMSTSIDPGRIKHAKTITSANTGEQVVPNQFGTSVRLTVEIEKGVRANYVEPLSPFAHEKELLLDKGRTLVVKSISALTDSRGRSSYDVVVGIAN